MKNFLYIIIYLLSTLLLTQCSLNNPFTGVLEDSTLESIAVEKEVSPTPSPTNGDNVQSDSRNLVKNGDFSTADSSGWIFFYDYSLDCSIDYSQYNATVKLKEKGGSPYSVQLYPFLNLPLTKGTYTISFDYISETPTDFYLTVEHPDNDYYHLLVANDSCAILKIDAVEEVQQFNYTFTIPETYYYNEVNIKAALLFGYCKTDIKITIDNFNISPALN